MKSLTLLFLLILSNYSYADNKSSISHQHNSRTHSHPLPASGIKHTHNSGNKKVETKNEFKWLNRNGWATLYQVCRLKKKFNPKKYKKTNCKNFDMKQVTGSSIFSSWAGKIIGVYYDKKRDNFTGDFKIKVTWTTGSPYKCGQIIENHKSKLKDFKHRSIKMKKCS